MADLDRDGRPDVAIADRTGRGAHGQRFSIEILLSNAPVQTVTFHSRHGAVALRLQDIDNDQDLDLVVTPALGNEVLAVWLNDGRGRFHEADLRDLAPVLPQAATAVVAAQPGAATPSAVLPRPSGDAGLLRRAVVGTPDEHRQCWTTLVGVRPSRLASPTALRGPPSLL